MRKVSDTSDRVIKTEQNSWQKTLSNIFTPSWVARVGVFTLSSSVLRESLMMADKQETLISLLIYLWIEKRKKVYNLPVHGWLHNLQFVPYQKLPKIRRVSRFFDELVLIHLHGITHIKLSKTLFSGRCRFLLAREQRDSSITASYAELYLMRLAWNKKSQTLESLTFTILTSQSTPPAWAKNKDQFTKWQVQLMQILLIGPFFAFTQIELTL